MCEKRPQKCLYCELEFPKNELAAHLDYCGSRTEPCTKCGQYIRLKDQVKHDESNCTFPPVKPANNDRNTADTILTRDRPLDIYGHSNNNSTARNEFDMALGGLPLMRELHVPYVPHVSKKDSGRGAGAGAVRTNVFNSGRPAKTVNTKAVKRADLNKQRGMYTRKLIRMSKLGLHFYLRKLQLILIISNTDKCNSLLKSD